MLQTKLTSASCNPAIGRAEEDSFYRGFVGLEEIPIDFSENQKDEMPGKLRFASNQEEEVKITLLGVHMDFIRRDPKVMLVFFSHWKETEDKQGLELWPLKSGAEEMVSTLHLNLPFPGFLFGLTVLLFSAPDAPISLGFTLLFRLIVRPIATSSKSSTGQVLFSNREFQEELGYSTAKLRDAIPSRKKKTLEVYI